MLTHTTCVTSVHKYSNLSPISELANHSLNSARDKSYLTVKLDLVIFQLELKLKRLLLCCPARIFITTSREPLNSSRTWHTRKINGVTILNKVTGLWALSTLLIDFSFEWHWEKNNFLCLFKFNNEHWNYKHIVYIFSKDVEWVRGKQNNL